jgi:hypothetical protein
MGHLPLLLRPEFRLKLDGEDAAAAAARASFRRDFLLYDVFDAVLAEITFHGDPTERDRWWREIGSRESDPGDAAEEDV